MSVELDRAYSDAPLLKFRDVTDANLIDAILNYPDVTDAIFNDTPYSDVTLTLAVERWGSSPKH